MAITLSTHSSDRVNWLREKPIAHRGLHDISTGIVENTLSACKAAMEAGYNIEVDLQLSGDGVPMVFHDFTIDRLTGKSGDIRNFTAEELGKIAVEPGNDTIPTLRQLLELIDGEVGIVLELKGKPGNDEGFLENVARELEGYQGNFAVMSFNHYLLRDARAIAPHLPLGLTAEGDDKSYDVHVEIASETNVEFISYDHEQLECRFVQEFLKTGRPVICWTIRTPAELEAATVHSHQPTFEGFLP